MKKFFISICGIIVIMVSGTLFILKSMEGQAVKVHREQTDEHVDYSRMEDAVRNMNSRHMLLLDMETGMEIMSKAADGRIYPASMTKIMTALLCIEHMDDLTQWVTLEEDMVMRASASGASVTGFDPGETVRAEDLLYAVLLTSGAEAAGGLAEYTAGSEAVFVDWMNEKAEELGMNDTHFANIIGLHNEKHYTTVRDMAVLLSYALQNDSFREIFYTREYTITETSHRNDGMYLKSTLLVKLDSIGECLEEGQFLGGKTGTTAEAGLCLASVAEIQGRQYMLITAKADYSFDGPAYNAMDAVKIYNSIR